jgi:hypothetical protein
VGGLVPNELAISVAVIVVTMVVLDRLESARTRMAQARRADCQLLTTKPAVRPTRPGPGCRARALLKNLLAAAIGLVVVTFAHPATAYVVQAITSIRTTPGDDEAQLRRAFEAAVADVLDHAIAFTPTVVTVRSVRVVGDRIYILLLFADADGEELMKPFLTDEP